ncbi:MAG: TonB-dependent receptor plug domain-containing protein [Cytophagales bacterium]|nr:TonB-dependent receptor plug domain-containing protein [Cytophagales bacterium]
MNTITQLRRAGLLLLFGLLAMRLQAQQIISGTVSDESNGETLPGVNIAVKGSTRGAITDINGQYSLQASATDSLVFSYIGYQTETVPVGNQSVIDMALVPDLKTMDEVIVIGYGTQKKTDKTGAVAHVTAKELNGGVLTDPIQGLQGKAAGVNMHPKAGARPNAGFAVQIRGQSGFTSGTGPLFVVDGVPGVDPTTIAPEDIESFNVLKDASSTAIYGSRGANGVVMITTKGTGKGGVTVDLNSYVSIDQVNKRLDLWTADDMRKYVAENGIDFNDGGANTDWQSEIFRTGMSQSHNVAVTGGNENSFFRASLTHADWKGVIKGSDKERTTVRLSGTQKALNDRLTIESNVAGTFEKNNYVSYGGDGPNDVLYQAYQRNPTDPVYDPNYNPETDREYQKYYELQRDFNYWNPVALIDHIQNERDAKRAFGQHQSRFADYQIPQIHLQLCIHPR